jgi:anhydro-N-acetylmuramic acid kinase
MSSRWLIGLACGSSCDGVDAALVEATGVGIDLQIRLLQAVHQPYGRDLPAVLGRVACGGPCETKQFALLHRLVGETLATAARQVADRACFSLQRVQCIGCPGQAVWQESEGRFLAALDLGMAAVVAERTGITTVSDFRGRDLAAAGQGVPVGAMADYLLFRHPAEHRVVVHLGGVSRVVFLRANGRFQDVVGFEAGPAGDLLDALIAHFTGGRETCDAGGKHAVQGRCLELLLQQWLAQPYFQRRPPKALPSHLFGKEFVTEVIAVAKENNAGRHDVLCTATHFVAHAVVESLRRFAPEYAPERVLLTGGATRNGLLWHLLQQQLPGVALERTDGWGVPAGAHKAMSSAVLAALTLDGIPASIPSATGAAGARLLGSLTPGSTTNWARCLSWMATQTAPLVMAYESENW